MISNAEHISCTLWHRRLVKSKKAKEEHTESLLCHQAVLSTPWGQRTRLRKRCGGTEPAPDEEPAQSGPRLSLWLHNTPLQASLLSVTPRKYQGKTVLMPQDKPAHRADGTPQKLHSGEDGWWTQQPPCPALPSRHTCAGNLLKTSSPRRHMVLTC